MGKEDGEEPAGYASDSSEAAFEENLRVMSEILWRSTQYHEPHHQRRKMCPNVTSEWLKGVQNRLRGLDQRV